ncbi:MAG TPA: hypothetical protein VJ304_08125, partial [Flavobacterium sp.]|nr:hypothetical protein [Flavobacterium sp.]
AGASMSYAAEIEGYETVQQRTDFFKGGKFVAVGDPEKAAKVMLDLASHPNPPVHLVLGSEAIGILKNADQSRTEEMEKWIDVSLSTDHDDAGSFFDTAQGKWYTNNGKK